MEDDEGAEEQERFSHQQRLKAAVHYTVGCLCEDVASDKEVQFSKQTIAAISEMTFRQCEHFAKDLEMFARHAKRSTINTEDVKLLARRSNSLLKYITEKNEELTQFNIEQRAKKKKKLEDDKTKSLAPAEAAASGMDSSAPSPGAEAAFGEGRQEQADSPERRMKLSAFILSF
ncbi:Centromere protein S [Vulpes lagopus]|uniref:centromere protein S isoform X1 n=1 Tax=Vulpes lagopus TaxID=494514 RepID=UPI001BCA15AF|nr:centromere protein S isoform X1 [Vulpes lagopus]